MEFVPFGAVDKIRLSVRIIQDVIAIPTKSGKKPSETECIKFMMLCQAQRNNPFAGDCFLTGYDSKDGTAKFSMITAHQTFIKRAESSAVYEGMESGIIYLENKEEKTPKEREGDFNFGDEIVIGGWAKVYQKGRKPVYKRLSIAQRKPNYPTPFWEGEKAAEQIVKCAEVDALRAAFPTLLGGMFSKDEMETTVTTVIPPEAAREMLQASPPPPTPALVKQVESGSPQDKVSALYTAAGHTFADAVKVLEQSNLYPDAGSLTDISELPKDVAKRILLAEKGFLKMLADLKGQAAQ